MKSLLHTAAVIVAALMLVEITGAALSRRDTSLPAISGRIEVFVKEGTGWVPVKTYDALCSDSPSYHGYMWNDWDNSGEYRDTMSFALIQSDFKKPVDIRVVSSDPFSSVDVRPTALGIRPEIIDSNTVEFCLSDYSSGKVSVEFDSDRYSNLFIICNCPDSGICPQSDSSLVYFGPGEHEPGEIILESGETLYIDSGAIVHSKVSVVGDDCTIAGHGILSGARLPHTGTQWATGEILIECNPDRKQVLKNLTVKDITIVDSPSWTLSVYNAENVMIDNVNIINWILNGDGIDLVCVRNAVVKNCFLRCYDDCISLKVRHNARPMSNLGNILVSDCLIWSDFARGIVIGPEAGNASVSDGAISDCTVENCVFLEHATIPEKDDVRGAFAIHQVKSPDWKPGIPPAMRSIRARGLVFDNMHSSGRAVVIAQEKDQEGISLMEDIVLEDIEVLDGGSDKVSVLDINTYGNIMSGITVSGFRRNGKNIIPHSWGRRVSGPDLNLLSPSLDVHIAGNVEISFKK